MKATSVSLSVVTLEFDTAEQRNRINKWLLSNGIYPIRILSLQQLKVQHLYSIEDARKILDYVNQQSPNNNETENTKTNDPIP